MSKTFLKAHFISLRSAGLSYDKISEEIGVSKTTLIAWNKKYLPLIEDATTIVEKQLLADIRAKRTLFTYLLTNKLEELYRSVLENSLDELSLKEKVTLIQQMENIINKITNIESHKKYLFDEEIKDERLAQALNFLNNIELDYKNKGTAKVVEDMIKEYIGKVDIPKEMYPRIQKNKS